MKSYPGFWLEPSTALGGGRSLPSRRVCDLFRHAHQVGQGFGVRFFHYVGAMRFDREFAHSELIRDLLVKEAGHDEIQHLFFARCEGIES